MLIQNSNETIRGLIAASRRTERYRERIRWAHHVVKGVAALHEANLSHGDMRLENLVVVDGVIKLAEFRGDVPGSPNGKLRLLLRSVSE